MTAPAIRAVLKRPFPEQLAFLRQRLKTQVPTAQWDDIWKSQHDRAFMVAGAFKAQLLADLAAAVEQSIASGGTIEEFRKAFDATVAQNGWAYTGERNWRTRVIYRTNAATSYAAGRLAQLRDGGFALWMYKHGGSAEPRPEHLAWDGLVLPSDHPFWATHSPPNDWGCSCRIVGVRDASVARDLGGNPSKQLPDDWDAIDTRTGEPVGVGKGWGYQPGATVTLQQQILDTAAKLPEQLATALVQSIQSVAPTLTSVDDFVAHGRGIVDSLPDAAADPTAFAKALVDRLRREVGIDTPAKVASSGAGAKMVQAASRLMPDSWTKAADKLGKLQVRSSQTRGWQLTARQSGPVRLPGFGIQYASAGDGWITTSANDIGVAVHEYAHRLQAALPELDRLFQDLHARRTAGAQLKPMRLFGPGYARTEMTREDHYVHPYMGKEYSGRGALEVMSMALESVLSAAGSRAPHRIDDLRKMYTQDRELFDLAVGLLFGWKP